MKRGPHAVGPTWLSLGYETALTVSKLKIVLHADGAVDLTRGGGPHACWRIGLARASTRAAHIYQHRTSLRERMIADEISRRVDAEHTRSGMQRARDSGASP